MIQSGKDLIGIAQTGTGKTGAFLIPAMERFANQDSLRTLVICPTRELAQQVAEDGRALAAHMDFWIGETVGGLPLHRQTRDLRAGVELLVATPGRLLDHLERGTVNLNELELLVLDEADRMLDMGFRPQIEQILAACPSQRQSVMFSATMPPGVHALALRILRDPEWVEAAPSATAADTIQQAAYTVPPERKFSLLLHLLEKQSEMAQVLVFTRTKRGADLLGKQLSASGVSVTVLHGDRDMRQRGEALADFADGRTRVLVATDVAQRGLDIAGISHVINYDVPRNPEDYVHRIGRTGRAGALGKAVTFITAGELGDLNAIERLLGYSIPRASPEGYEYSGASSKSRTVASGQREAHGGRLGSRRKDLSPDELQKILRVG